MASRAQSITIGYLAWDTANAVGKTGDVANHTLRVVKDGGSPTAPTNSAAEIDSTNMPGWYKLVLTSTETTADVVILGGKSSSSGIVICGTLVTLENLPTPAPGAANGVFIAGTNAATVITTSLTTHLVGTVDTVTTLTNLPAVTTNWLTGTGVDATAVTKIQSGLSTYAGGDTSGTTTLLARLTSTRAGLLDNLDAAISTRSTYAGGDTSGTTTLLGRLTSTRAGLLDNLDAAVSTRSTYAGGAVASVTAAVTLDKTQTLSAARNISAVADTSLTLNDALHCAIAAAAGQETVVSTAYTVKTPSTGTTLRIFTLDSTTAPTSRT